MSTANRPLDVAVLGTRGIPAHYGGFETCAEQVSVRLAARGHKVTVYCRTDNAALETTSHEGVHLVHVPFVDNKALSTLSHTALSMVRAMRAGHDSYLVFNAGNAPIVAAARLVGRPAVVNVDGLEWKRGKWGPIGRRYYLFCEWLVGKVAARLIADARAIGDYYERRWLQPTTFIPYGAPPTAEADASLLAEYGLEPGGYVLMASRIEPENNALTLVRAWAGFETDKQLVIVGSANWDSPYEKGLHKIADPTVRFLGGVYAPGHYDALVANCHAFVHGNEVGGTNPGLLNAMGLGASIVAIDVDFNREVAGDTALYWRNDPDDLRRLLGELEAQPERAAALGERGRARVAALYDWDDVTDRYEHLLHEVRARRISRRSERD